MKLDIKIDKGDIKDALGKYAKKLSDNRDLLEELGEIIEEDIRHRIVKLKKDPDDKPWKPWAKATKKARQKRGTAALGLLFESGELADSITHKVTGKNKLQVGTSNPYAGYLNEGTNNMPARPFIGISKRASKGIDEALKLYFGGKK